jgi:CheY-like chemotaxis protein
MSARPLALLLRAQVQTRMERLVAYTLELADRSVFVRTPVWMAEGTTADIQLSFPGLLRPFALSAVVSGTQQADRPGALQGIRFTFQNGDRGRSRVAEILARAGSGVSRVVPRQLRLLVVEDNDLVAEMFSTAPTSGLAGRGNLAVQVVRSGEEALEALETLGADLLLVDYYLPDGTGAQLVEKIRRGQTQASPVPIIGITVGGVPAASAFLAAGADFCIDKPFSVRNFFRTIEVLQ